MLRVFVFVAALFVCPAYATQVQADVAAGTTQCGWYLDGATTPSIVTIVPPATTCRFPLAAGLTAGTHTIAADARMPDPLWGTLTSPKSATFSFTKPAGGGTAPSNLVLVP